MTVTIIVSIAGGIAALWGVLENRARRLSDSRREDAERRHKELYDERTSIAEMARLVEERRVNVDNQANSLLTQGDLLRVELNIKLAKLTADLELSDQRCEAKLAAMAVQIVDLRASHERCEQRNEEMQGKYTEAVALAAKWEARTEAQIVAVAGAQALAQTAKDIATDVETHVKGGASRWDGHTERRRTRISG